MATTINNRLAYLESCFAEIDAETRTWRGVLDTYEGMLSLCNDGEGSDGILANIDRVAAEIATLDGYRAELDLAWNEALLTHEAA